MAEQSKKVILKTNDDNIFEIEQDIVKQFRTLNAMMEEEGFAESSIPLPNIGSSELTPIIDYCRKHSEFRTSDRDRSGDAKAFDEAFVKGFNSDELKGLMLAANYLDFKELLDLLCQGTADRIKNKSVKYVRDFFGINNDYTPEEENALREKHAWAYEGVDADDDE
ncbi:hypothetical protein L6164_017288 [Bauhinia variegata]|uniref:Uncharacterized protein n=1 Tax=Bauhinia variegata TaxID=167791 RepID=A0ACB9N8L0_BAUVA|nr:hypothetical protein L6164_017288 [Bauhinia variegata]